MSKCRDNPKKFSRFRGKCLSGRRTEKIKERHEYREDDDHGHHEPNHQ